MKGLNSPSKLDLMDIMGRPSCSSTRLLNYLKIEKAYALDLSRYIQVNLEYESIKEM